MILCRPTAARDANGRGASAPVAPSEHRCALTELLSIWPVRDPSSSVSATRMRLHTPLRFHRFQRLFTAVDSQTCSDSRPSGHRSRAYARCLKSPAGRRPAALRADLLGRCGSIAAHAASDNQKKEPHIPKAIQPETPWTSIPRQDQPADQVRTLDNKAKE